MSSEGFEIPRHGKAGVAFLGVELSDAWILILSVFIGLGAGSLLQLGVKAYVGIPIGGYILNKLFVDWRSKSVPGELRNYLFRTGLMGYTNAFKGGNVVFEGDSKVINPDSQALIDHALRLRIGHQVSNPNIRGGHGA